MTSQELSDWQEYEKIDPFGLNRFDLLNAMSMQLLANVNRDEKKRPTPYSTKDFMPKYGKEEKPINLLDKVKGINALLGGSEK